MTEYRIVIDQSTSGTKVILFDTETETKLIDRVDKSHEQIYPKKGWVEHDPIKIIKNTEELIERILQKNSLSAEEIMSLSITNQRESIVVWDKLTGEPYTNVMVWQCNRGIDICDELNNQGLEDMVRNKTGLNIDPYFSGSKLKWFFENFELTENQLENLAIGTIDSWLVWNLSDEKNHFTEASNASRTLLFDIKSKNWDQELCDLFDVSKENLPTIKNSVDSFGTYLGIPIVSIIADSQSALLGSGCFKEGEIKATLGTGSSILVNIGNRIIENESSILSTVAWSLNEELTYALEGVIRSYGDILNWQRDQLELFSDFTEASELAFELYDNGGVYFVPALEGLGAPFWEPEVHAELVGMSRSHNKSHIIRAGFEAMAYQTRIIIDTIHKDFDLSIEQINVDGGLVNNQEFMQLLADVTNKDIAVGNIEEASALGTLIILGENIPMKDKKVYKPKNSFEEQYLTWKQRSFNAIENNKVKVVCNE